MQLSLAVHKTLLSPPAPHPHPTPGYPLTELGSAAHETLLAAVGACPSLAQEGAFRNCVDCLLGEVRAELPSYGTRIMLQALMERNPSVCSEATQRVKQAVVCLPVSFKVVLSPSLPGRASVTVLPQQGP